jgi:hypothetical protein
VYIHSFQIREVCESARGRMDINRLIGWTTL